MRDMLDQRDAIIWLAAVLHASWALSLCLTNEPLLTTSMTSLIDLFGGDLVWAGLFCVTASLLALIYDVNCYSKRVTGLSQILLYPQQFLVVSSGLGAMNAVIKGHFADGAPYPRLFIWNDQFIYILLAVAHSWILIEPFFHELLRERPGHDITHTDPNVHSNERNTSKGIQRQDERVS